MSALLYARLRDAKTIDAQLADLSDRLAYEQRQAGRRGLVVGAELEQIHRSIHEKIRRIAALKKTRAGLGL